MIIDFHTHIFPKKVKTDRNNYIKRDACFAALYSSPKAVLASAEDLISDMDKDEVDISVVLNIGWTKQELCIETNDYILESVARYPKRLIGFCTVQLGSLEAALKEIERCVAGGIRGVGEIRPDVQAFDLRNIEVMKPFIDEIVRHNLILLTHTSEPVGHEYPGKGAVTPDTIYPLITRFPDLQIVCAHWGGGLPFYAMMPEVKKAIKNVFFDTAASPFLYTSQIYNQVIQLVGAGKLLFGSDYPLLAPSRIIGEIKSLSLPEDMTNLILSGNAERLLGIMDY